MEATFSPSHRGRVSITCPRCGSFVVTNEAMWTMCQPNWATPRQRIAASSWVREHPETELFQADLEKLLKVEYPSVAERADKILLAIARQTHGSIGAEYDSPFEGEADIDLQAVSWSANGTELRYLLDKYLDEKKGWLTKTGNSPDSYIILPAGHDHLDSLRRGVVDSDVGFCAMWFDPEVQSAWDEAISPAIADAGYRPRRIDELQHVNRIDDEILVQIRRCKFVVADFTGQRHGVYFEAGFALGLGRPVIWTVQQEHLSQIHFDNRQYNFIVWSAEDLPVFRKALAARIEAVLGKGSFSA